MADHCRKQIRDALQAYLAANVTTAVSVISGRVHPIETAILPALLIYTNEETAEDIGKNSGTGQDRKIERTLTLTVEGYATGDTVIDTLDGMAAEVEPLVVAGLPAWVKETSLMETAVELTGEAQEPAGMIRLTYEVIYHANMATPDTPA